MKHLCIQPINLSRSKVTTYSNVFGCYSVHFSCSPSSIDHICAFKYGCIRNSMMKHLDFIFYFTRKSNLFVFSYAYRKCTFDDSLIEIIGPPSGVYY